MTSVVLTEDIAAQELNFDSGEESMMGEAHTDGGSAREKGKVQKSLRDRIVIDHLPLIKAIAGRVHESMPVDVDLDDLIYAGILGFVHAASKSNLNTTGIFHSDA